MELQYSKMILYGLIRAFFYIGLPLILITILSLNNIITFSQSFITYLLIIGSIGVVLTILKHMFPKNTIANRLISFTVKVYQGIYLFYIFGGFTPGVRLGTYYINTPEVQVILGLQLIAWLLLGIAGVSAIKHLIEALELKKQKEYRVKIKKRFRVSRVFKGLGALLYLIMIGYIASIILSGLNLEINIHEVKTEDIGWNVGNKPIDPADDTINITVYFDVINMGIYSVYNVHLAADIYTLISGNPGLLPVNKRIGKIRDVYYKRFKALFITHDQSFTINIDPTYAPPLAITDAILELRLSFSSLYAGISIELNTSIEVLWLKLLTL